MDVLYPNCAGLDVHKDTAVACARRVTGAKVTREVRTFKTTTGGLFALSEWLSSQSITHIAMEATGIYWKPVWNILSDGDFVLMLANAAHVKNVPGRKTDVNDATWLADLLAHGLIRASFVPNTRAARTAAHAQAADARTHEPRSTSAKDARRSQHQARLGDFRRYWCEWAGHDRGVDRGRDRSAPLGRSGSKPRPRCFRKPCGGV